MQKIYVEKVYVFSPPLIFGVQTENNVPLELVAVANTTISMAVAFLVRNGPFPEDQ